MVEQRKVDFSSFAVQNAINRYNIVVNTSSSNRLSKNSNDTGDVLKYARGLGMFTNQNYYAGYDRFGGKQDKYYVNDKGYTELDKPTKEWIG